MLTIFTTPKPFVGHSAIIQKNALKSWTLLHPDVEVILFGDEEGAAEATRELGVRHEPHVERAGPSAKYLNYLFGRAEELASHKVLSYINCDIILLSDYGKALERVAAKHDKFLMVGRRWGVDVTEPIDFLASGWQKGLRDLALTRGEHETPASVDYFTFTKGLFPNIPPMVIGRIWWDHWLVWKARQNGAEIVDASDEVMAIHQNHDYGYHPGGRIGVWNDELAVRNKELAGSKWHLYTIEDATRRLTPTGESGNWKRAFMPYKRWITPAWYTALDWTRPIRHAMGLRKKPKVS
jgi:hypothetical protein